MGSRKMHTSTPECKCGDRVDCEGLEFIFLLAARLIVEWLPVSDLVNRIKADAPAQQIVQAVHSRQPFIPRNRFPSGASQLFRFSSHGLHVFAACLVREEVTSSMLHER